MFALPEQKTPSHSQACKAVLFFQSSGLLL